MVKIKIFLGLLLITGLQTFGQTEKHLIYFRDKANSPFSLDRPTEFLSAKALTRRQKNNVQLDNRDLPVNPGYVSQINATGAEVLYKTKWLNGIIVEATTAQLSTILSLPFVQRGQILQLPSNSGVRNENQVIESNSQSVETTFEYGTSTAQINLLGIDSMHREGISGKQVSVAVFDSGFPAVDTHEAFEYHFANGLYKSGYDFVDRTPNVFRTHDHGTKVLSNISAYLPGKLMGGAYDANLYLFRTEDASTEYEIECAYWLVAAEKADSLGVDVINSSLGYIDFDNPAQDYTYSMLDGNTTIISKAARIAGAKGMIVVTSAGNSGGNVSWGGYISAPADADSILTVGAVSSTRTYAGFSSRGPTADGRIKPDIVAMGVGNTIVDHTTRSEIRTGSGTSFASPMIAGLVAGLMEKFPNIKAVDLIQAIKMAGDSSATPNNRVGYGIPTYSKVVYLVTSISNKRSLGKFQVFPNPAVESITIALPISELGNAQYDVIDLNGKKIQSGEVEIVNLRASIQTSSLPTGIFRLVVKTAAEKQFFSTFSRQ